MTVEDPDGQNIWNRKDGATRRSAPFTIEAIECSNEREEDFDLVDLDEEQPLMAHTGQLDGLEGRGQYDEGTHSPDEATVEGDKGVAIINKEVRRQQEDFQVRKAELYWPQEVQEEVNKNFQHGFTNPASGLKTKSTPMTNKEVAGSRGDAMLEC
eukprot:11835244-Prorocentrum_lima.AAC.1